MISPDSFPYFLVLFFIGIFSGTYLLFTYYINRLLVINAIVLFLSAARVASEYYIQQLDTYEQVVNYAPWHIFPVNLLIPLQWAMILFYVRPLSGWKWEKAANNVLLFGLLIIPFLGHNYFCTIDPQLFYYHPERIDGYWKFAVNTDFWYHSFYSLHTQLAFFLLLAALLTGIIRGKKNQLRQSFLLGSYILAFFLYYGMTPKGEWNTPSTGILYLVHTLLISWYVSDYRLFKSNFNLITKNLFESISDLTISTDPDLNITGVNSRTTALFHQVKGNMQDWLQQNDAAISPDSLEQLQGLLEQRVEKIEILLQDNKGEVRAFDLKVAPFSNQDRLFGYTFLLTDLSETQKREKELTELNANKDRLFTIIAHDLRKPALSFRGIGKKINYLIAKDDQERLKAFGRTIGKAAFSLNSLLDNLLKWAAQQQNLLPSNPGVLDLLAITEEISRDMAIMAEEKEIDLQFSIPPHTMVYVDPNGLLTIIRNLIDNAIKFTARGGVVRFSASTLDDRVTLSVSDDGIGIAPEELHNLFELSETVSRRGTEGEKGTGLGLHLVRELVKINQGTISVESTQAQGSVFSVVFPKQAENATS